MTGSSIWCPNSEPVNIQRLHECSMTGYGQFSIDSFVDSYLQDLKSAIDSITSDDIDGLVSRVLHSRSCGASIHFIGNGGSAATPSHSAGDWSKELRVRTIAHTDNIASFTAWANDEGYDQVFVQALKTYIQPDDLVVAYTGSGNSTNVILALEYAKENNIQTVGITGNYMGKGTGIISQYVDHLIHFNTESMERIEDLQLVVNHIVKEAIKVIDSE